MSAAFVSKLLLNPWTLGLATLIASIAELKHRHCLLSFTYKYIPLGIAFFGALIWGFSFLFEGSTASVIRSITSSFEAVGAGAVSTLVK